jgi:hypothetical protein
MPERDPHRPAFTTTGGQPPADVPQYSYSWLPYVLGGIVALVLAFAITRLNYGFGQAPHRIVKMLLGVSFLAFTVFRPKIALHLWLLAMPIAAWLPVTGIPGLNGVNLLFVVSVLGWVVPWFMSGERLLPHTRVGPALGFYIVVLFASAIRTILFPPEGTDYTVTELLLRVWQRVPALAIYFVAVGSITNYKRIRSMIGTFAVSAGVAAVIAFRQFATTPDMRRIGAGMNPNDFAAYVAMLATALIAHVFTSSAFKRVRRLVVWVAAAFASIAVLLPKSRGGYVGFAGGLSVVTYLISKKAFIIFLLVLLASPLWAPGFVKDRVLETEVQSVEAQITGDVTDRLDPSAAVRIEVWGIVLSEVASRPLFGYGFGSVPRLTLGRMGTPFSAHSLYFETLGDMGLIGVAALLWLLAACVRSGLELMRRATSPLTRGLAIGFVAASAVLLLANVFGQRFLHRSIAGSYFVLAGLVDRSILLEKDSASARHEEAMTS